MSLARAATDGTDRQMIVIRYVNDYVILTEEIMILLHDTDESKHVGRFSIARAATDGTDLYMIVIRYVYGYAILTEKIM